MKLRLIRGLSEQGATIGTLFVDGLFECLTLEDEVRLDPKPETPANEAKVACKTAIPPGTYKVILSMSPKFKRILPEVLNVPGFSGIRIHKGNKPEDTEGCILLGLTKVSYTFISGSGLAFDALFPRLQAATDITLEIENGF